MYTESAFRREEFEGSGGEKQPEEGMESAEFLRFCSLFKKDIDIANIGAISFDNSGTFLVGINSIKASLHLVTCCVVRNPHFCDTYSAILNQADSSFGLWREPQLTLHALSKNSRSATISTDLE